MSGRGAVVRGQAWADGRLARVRMVWSAWRHEERQRGNCIVPFRHCGERLRRGNPGVARRDRSPAPPGLLGREAKPGREVAPGLEPTRVNGERQAQRADRADAGHLGQQRTDRVGLVLLFHPAFQLQNPSRKRCAFRRAGPLARPGAPASSWPRLRHASPAATASSSAGSRLVPLAATTPNSAAWPRTAWTSCVRCRTSNSRAESRPPRPAARPAAPPRSASLAAPLPR